MARLEQHGGDGTSNTVNTHTHWTATLFSCTEASGLIKSYFDSAYILHMNLCKSEISCSETGRCIAIALFYCRLDLLGLSTGA